MGSLLVIGLRDLLVILLLFILNMKLNGFQYATFLFAAVGIAKGESPPIFDCLHNGRGYMVGQPFMKDCNHCMCIAEDYSPCTRMICEDKVLEPTYYEESDFCMHNGEGHLIGDRFKDDCNYCECHEDGLVSCTMMMCIP